MKKVGMTGFEPATPRTPCVCATRLRHIPNKKIGTKVGVAEFEPTLECPYFIGITLQKFYFFNDFGY